MCMRRDLDGDGDRVQGKTRPKLAKSQGHWEGLAACRPLTPWSWFNPLLRAATCYQQLILSPYLCKSAVEVKVG